MKILSEVQVPQSCIQAQYLSKCTYLLSTTGEDKVMDQKKVADWQGSKVPLLWTWPLDFTEKLQILLF